MDFMKMLDKVCGEELLQKHVDTNRANKEQNYYYGKVECEICHCDFTDQQYLADCGIKGHPVAIETLLLELEVGGNVKKSRFSGGNKKLSFVLFIFIELLIL